MYYYYYYYHCYYCDDDCVSVFFKEDIYILITKYEEQSLYNFLYQVIWLVCLLKAF